MGRRPKDALLPEAESGDQLTIPVHVAVVEVAKLATALADELQETAAGVVVVLVRLEVGREVLDTLRENRDLHFRRAGVRRVDREVLDQLVFALLSQQPSS